MKVILNQDMNNLGEEGDICNVARGYARNYLIPKGIAVSVTKANKALFEQKKEAIEKRKEEKRKSAMDLKDRLEGVTLTIQRPAGDTGRLFASVTNSVIAEALEKEGITVERKKIDVATSTIKMIGTYSVKIKLYANETATIKIEVVAAGTKKEQAKEAEKVKAEKNAVEQEPVAEEAVETSAEAPVDDEAAEEAVAEEAAVEEAVEEEIVEEEKVQEEDDAPVEEESSDDDASDEKE